MNSETTETPISDEVDKKLWDGFFSHFIPATMENHSLALSTQDIISDYLPWMGENEETLKVKLNDEGFKPVNLGNALYYLVNPKA